MGKSNSSRRLRTRAASCRVPANSRSPSEAPTITGTFSSRAASKIPFSRTRSAMLKCPMATQFLPASSTTSMSFFIGCFPDKSFASRLPGGLTITDQLRYRQMVWNSRSASYLWLVAPGDRADIGQFLRSTRTRRYGRPLCGKTTVRERRKLLRVPANWKTVNPTEP